MKVSAIIKGLIAVVLGVTAVALSLVGLTYWGWTVVQTVGVTLLGIIVILSNICIDWDD